MKYEIYGKQIPFNTGLSKYDALVPYDDSWSVGDSFETLFNPDKRRRDMIGPNNVIRKVRIPEGGISDKFDDVPYLLSYVVEGAKDCVLICPGGAYCDVSVNDEGIPTAEKLNKMGITAFVLKYRYYPYLYPTAATDCKRAMQWLKAHADEFGYSKDRISLMGFSAGGNLILTTGLMYDELPKDPNYVEDEIDKIDAKPATLVPVYAEATADTFLASIQFGGKIYEDQAFAEKLKNEFYLPSHIKKTSPPMFITDCIDDTVVPVDNSLRLALACSEVGCKFEIHSFVEGGHGYGSTDHDIPAIPEFGVAARDMSGTGEWLRLFTIWMKKVLKDEK